jgi:hypothetical protein
VDVTGFEPATPCLQQVLSQLSYTPTAATSNLFYNQSDRPVNWECLGKTRDLPAAITPSTI